MRTALVDESGQLTLDLYGTLSEIDEARWQARTASEARSKIRAISERLAALVAERWPEQTEALRHLLETLKQRLDNELPDEDSTFALTSKRWIQFRAEVTPAYEALSRKLREYEIHVPTLRPTNYRRSIVHVLSAATCVAILYFVPHPAWGLAVIGPLFIWAWTVEIMRRTRPRMNELVMKAFGPIAHPYEQHRINSATWYVTAIMILALTMSPMVCAIGLAVLGVGDPAAGFIGRRYGRIKIMHGRTVEGGLGFLAAAIPASLLAAFLFAPTLPFATLLALAASASFAGAVAEIVSLRVDDNLSVSLVATAVAALMALALGVPL